MSHFSIPVNLFLPVMNALADMADALPADTRESQFVHLCAHRAVSVNRLLPDGQTDVRLRQDLVLSLRDGLAIGIHLFEPDEPSLMRLRVIQERLTVVCPKSPFQDTLDQSWHDVVHAYDPFAARAMRLDDDLIWPLCKLRASADAPNMGDLREVRSRLDLYGSDWLARNPGRYGDLLHEVALRTRATT